MQAFSKKKVAVALAVALTAGVGSAWANTHGNVTKAPAYGVIKNDTSKLYVEVGQVASFVEQLASGGNNVFNANANGKTIDLVLGNAVWASDSTNTAGNVAQAVLAIKNLASTAVYFSFTGGSGTACKIDFGAMNSASWGGNASSPHLGTRPEVITLPLTATDCADGQPLQQLNVDFTKLMLSVSAAAVYPAGAHQYANGADWGTYPRIIDITNSNTGAVTLTAMQGPSNGLPGVESDNSPALINIVNPDVTIETVGTATTFTPGRLIPIPAFTVLENAANALRCDTAGLPNDNSTKPALVLTLPQGLTFGNDLTTSTGPIVTRNTSLTLPASATTVSGNVLYERCTSFSTDLGPAASAPYATPYQGAKVQTYNSVAYTIFVPNEYAGTKDIIGTLTVHLSNGETRTQSVTLASIANRGLDATLVDNEPTGLQTVFTGRTYGNDTGGLLRNPKIADQVQITENAVATIPHTQNGTTPVFALETINARQNEIASYSANINGVYKLTTLSDKWTFSAGVLSQWRVNDGTTVDSSVGATFSTTIKDGHIFTFPGLTIGWQVGDVKAKGTVNSGEIESKEAVILKAIDATTFTTSGALPIVSQDQAQFGPSMVLKENIAGALQTETGQPGTVSFDLLGTLSSDVPGKWVLGEGGTTATWCGAAVPAANLSLSQGSPDVSEGGRLNVKLPSISADEPCTLQVEPRLYAQVNAEPGQPINVVLFDPNDPLEIEGYTAAPDRAAPNNMYATQTEKQNWAQPTVSPINKEPIRQLGQIGGGPQGEVSGVSSGTSSSFNLVCQFQAPQAVQNTVKTIYVAAVLPNNSAFFFMDNNGAWHQYTGEGDWKAYFNGVVSPSVYNIQVANGLDVTGLPTGTSIVVGWGNSSTDVVNTSQYKVCHAFTD